MIRLQKFIKFLLYTENGIKICSIIIGFSLAGLLGS